MSNRKPDFLGIGAMKAGSSSLYQLLRGHPDIFMCPEKDSGFFSFDAVYDRGWDWYESLFDGATNETVVGEVSVGYTKRAIAPHTVSRIQKHLPEAKFVYIVREPLSRIESHYLEMQKRRSHTVSADFNRAVRERRTFIETSLYWKQYNWYRDHFPEERILVVFFEDFVEDPQSVLSKVYSFVGVDPNHQIGDPSAPNPASRSWTDKPINTRLRKMPLYDRIDRRWIPAGLRNLVRPWLKKPIVQRPQWDEVTRQWAMEQLADDSQQILAHGGKPADYWSLP